MNNLDDKKATDSLYAQSCSTQAQSTYGILGTDYKPTLRDRVGHQLYSALNEMTINKERSAKLEELQTLLSRHPEVARILELLDEVKF